MPVPVWAPVSVPGAAGTPPAMTTPEPDRLPDPADGADAKQHGDPLLTTAQGEGREDGTRHGTAPQEDQPRGD